MSLPVDCDATVLPYRTAYPFHAVLLSQVIATIVGGIGCTVAFRKFQSTYFHPNYKVGQGNYHLKIF